MKFSAKLALITLVGFCIMVIVSIAGCGSVDLAGLGPDAGESGAGGATGAAGADGGDTVEMAKLDGSGVAGAGGTGGAAGTAGAPGRPLAAGCSADDQCGSGVCATDINGSKACCDGKPDACTTCVNGYKTPRSDGTGCGPEMCDGTDRKWSLCKAGVCTAEVVQCAAALCDKAGNKICPGGAAPVGCALEDNPCFCYDAAGSGHVSYPCPTP